MFKPLQATLTLYPMVSGGEKEWCLRKTRNGKKERTKNGKKRNGNRDLKSFFLTISFSHCCPASFLKNGEMGYLRLFLRTTATTAIGIAIATQAAAMYTAEGTAPLLSG